MSFERTLTGLEATLETFVAALNNEETKTQLQKALHDDRGLPDKQASSAAARVVDRLGEIQHLLEPAHLILADHFLGYTNTKCLVAAVELGIPDQLVDGPLTVEELAKETKAKPERLRQILRPLYCNNIFSYDAAHDKYSLNHVSTLLLKDHWTQWHNWVQLYGNQFYDIARGIPESIREDVSRSAAQVNFDIEDNMFTYFQKQGWLPQLHRTLGGGATAMAPGILADYPWQEVEDKTVIDIGGGGGALLASLLRAHPKMQGALFDLPAVISHITPFFSEGQQFADLESRVKKENLIAGDFLDSIPKFEVYTIKWCLHDWDDETSIKILKNIREAIIPGAQSRLVVLESVLSDTRSGRLSVYGDINMMMTAKGRERTESQWRSLADQSGWRTEAIYPLRNAWVQAIDLRPQ